MLTEQPRRFDLVVLDVMLPGIDGFAVTAELSAPGAIRPRAHSDGSRTLQKNVLRWLGPAPTITSPAVQLPIFLSRVRRLLRHAGGSGAGSGQQDGSATPQCAFASKVIDFEQLEVRSGTRRLR